MTNYLASGLIGASLALAAAFLYSNRARQADKRAETAMEVVSWIDDVYDRLITIHAQRDATFTGAAFGISNDEYRQAVKEAKALLLASKTRAKVALAHGQGIHLDRFDTLKEEFVSVAGLLLEANKDNWEKTNKEINYRLTDVIDPLMASTESAFVTGPGGAVRPSRSMVVRAAPAAGPAGAVAAFVGDQAVKFWEAALFAARVGVIASIIGLIAWNYLGRPDIAMILKRLAAPPENTVSFIMPEAAFFPKSGGFGPGPAGYEEEGNRDTR